MSGLNAVRDVVDYFAGHERPLRLAILGTSAYVCLYLLFRMRTEDGFKKAFYALRDGGLKSLMYSDVDASEVDAKWYNVPYHMLLEGMEPMDFLLECRRLDSVNIENLYERCDQAWGTAERYRIEKDSLYKRLCRRTVERDKAREARAAFRSTAQTLREKLSLRMAERDKAREERDVFRHAAESLREKLRQCMAERNKARDEKAVIYFEMKSLREKLRQRMVQRDKVHAEKDLPLEELERLAEVEAPARPLRNTVRHAVGKILRRLGIKFT